MCLVSDSLYFSLSFISQDAELSMPDAPVHLGTGAIDANQRLIVPDSDQSDVDMNSVESDADSSPTRETTSGVPDGKTGEEEGKKDEEKKDEEEMKEKEEEQRDEGVANIITDLFSTDERPRKPPPKKKTM